MKHRFSIYLEYSAVLAGLLLLGWAMLRLVHHPDAGILWSADGKVQRITPWGPALGRVQPSDRILTIDAIPVAEAILHFSNKQVGEPVQFVLERDGRRIPVDIYLAHPSLPEVFSRVQPIWIALAFWGVSVVVVFLRRPRSQPYAFLWFFQTASAALALGAMSTIGPLWTVRVFWTLTWWLGVLAIQLHLHFPVSSPIRQRRWLLAAPYVVCAAASLTNLLTDPLVLRTRWPEFSSLNRLWLAACLTGAMLLLARNYRLAPSPRLRGQAGGVAIGGIVALAPLAVLSLAPDVLLGYPILPYEVTLLFLVGIPGAYGYVLLRPRLTKLDRYVSETITYSLVLMLLATLHVVLVAAVSWGWPGVARQPLVAVIIALLLAILFGPTHRRLRFIVNHLFYGGSYDYRSAVHHMARLLDNTTEFPVLTQSLCQGMRQAMYLKCVCFVPLRSSNNAPMTEACSGCPARVLAGQRLAGESLVWSHFESHSQPATTGELSRVLHPARGSASAAGLQACPQAELWVPVTGGQGPIGLLILGPKHSGHAYDEDDLEILQVVARQSGIALQNAQLIAELQQRALESERLHGQVVCAREDERKRVARDLHDHIIQSLVGLNFDLSSARSDPNVDAWITRHQGEIRRMVSEMRRICTDLRPPTLDTLGLVAAVRAKVQEVEGQTPLRITVEVEGDEEQEVHEDIAVCLFRVLQEALANVQRHAQARQTFVGISLNTQEVRLSIEDDGVGFVTPLRLGQLAHAGHFGLLGLQERLSQVKGNLAVVSAPAQGTRVEACVPLGMASDS